MLLQVVGYYANMTCNVK